MGTLVLTQASICSFFSPQFAELNVGPENYLSTGRLDGLLITGFSSNPACLETAPEMDKGKELMLLRNDGLGICFWF